MFRCTICGECCRGDQAVWLNSLDMSRLADYVDRNGLRSPALADCPSPEDFLVKQRIVIVESGQNGAMRPRLRFRPGPAGPSCPFLVNDLDEKGRLWGKCSLHDTRAKPLVCRLAPLARTVDLTDGSEVWMEVPPVAGCPGWKAGEEPPPEGRAIPDPNLEVGMRADLDGEIDYFRRLTVV
ncbi:MAG: YkgJ family cysteine cluster protein [Spirochaetaceae bacterium]|nr:YkgJ family cysteine cluster protein [Spirochaetaceae bacterium]MDT8298485.1 YkgJ family cysteine cluster protein [Spirochaetaceae bacterium]